MLTQGSVLRPQPWAGKSQLRQSCCCLLEAPPHALPKGRELLLAEFDVVMRFAFPFEKAGMGPAGGMGLLFGFFPIVYCVREGDEINTKSRVVDGGFALVCTVAPIVGKRVFLRVVSTIPTVMRCMTPSATTVKKAAFGRSKSPAFAGTKTAANRRPSPNLLKPLLMPSPRVGSSTGGPSPCPPQGAGAHSRCV